MSKLGRKLIKLRGDLMQEDIAEIIGVSQSAYNRWENGKSMPRLENLKKLAEHYNVSVDELKEDKEKINVSNNDININGENKFNNIINIQQSPELIELVQKQTEQITKATELITKALDTQFRITEVLNKKN
jgi:transcriptional regulator with XRE-family HTH domain